MTETSGRALWTMRILSAIALLATGGIHLYLALNGVGGLLEPEAEREQRDIDEELGHPEAHERERHAGQRNHREVAGDRHRELA